MGTVARRHRRTPSTPQDFKTRGGREPGPTPLPRPRCEAHWIRVWFLERQRPLSSTGRIASLCRVSSLELRVRGWGLRSAPLGNLRFGSGSPRESDLGPDAPCPGKRRWRARCNSFSNHPSPSRFVCVTETRATSPQITPKNKGTTKISGSRGVKVAVSDSVPSPHRLLMLCRPLTPSTTQKGTKPHHLHTGLNSLPSLVRGSANSLVLLLYGSIPQATGSSRAGNFY